MLAGASLLMLALVSCKKHAKAASDPPAASASAAHDSHSEDPNDVKVSHGELDTRAPDNSPKIAATVLAATIYKLPNTESRKLGYVRLGGIIQRDQDPVSGHGCKSKWYHVYPMGYMCTDEATTNLNDPLVRAADVRPDLSTPMPYHYGFVRATAPLYLHVPTKAEQEKSEFKLDDHLQWYAQHKDEVQQVILGANDVPLDAHGIATPGLQHQPGFRLSTTLSLNELLGGKSATEAVPWWLEGGRKIPNVSGFEVPDYAVFANRVRRKTGLSFVDAFDTNDNGFHRGFAVTVDMMLVPTSKIKPETGSPFHGIEITPAMPMPFAWVNRRGCTLYKLIRDKDEAVAAEPIPRRAIVPLTGDARIKGGRRYYQTLRNKQRWLLAADLGIVFKPQTWPDFALKGEKWIDISLQQQTLVLYDGTRPWYATLVSTGRDRDKDPKTTLSTIQGVFRLKSKHVCAMMDSDENSDVAGGRREVEHVARSPDAEATIARIKKEVADGKKLSEDDRRRLENAKKGRPIEYGITIRRGSRNFQLRDVPWIEYFAAGYALHGAYWHDVFGIPRSHGCVNLSPIDARVVFMWTDPPVPKGWHGINIGDDMGQGTIVDVHE
jgi:L,D-transpeptidase catalytic domain